MSVERSVARLRELALKIPRPMCDWEERPRFDLPADPKAIAAVEKAVGFVFPKDIRTFFAITNAVVGMSVHNGYWLGGVEQTAHSIERDDYRKWHANGKPALLVATDGGGNAFLMTDDIIVWRWDHETDTVVKVAASFEDFLERVVDDWEAYISEKPGWRFLV